MWVVVAYKQVTPTGFENDFHPGGVMPTSVLDNKLAENHVQHIFGGGFADDLVDGVGGRIGIDKNSKPGLQLFMATGELTKINRACGTCTKAPILI